MKRFDSQKASPLLFIRKLSVRFPLTRVREKNWLKIFVSINIFGFFDFLG